MAYEPQNYPIPGRPFLENIVDSYINDTMSYQASKVFPTITGLTAKTKIAKYKKGAWFRDLAQKRAPGNPAVKANYYVDDQNIDAIDFAIGTDVPYQELQEARENANALTEPFADAARFCANNIAIRIEKEVAEAVQTTDWNGLGAGGEDAEGLWASDTNTNTLVKDIEKASLTILSKTGIMPNKIFMDYYTWNGIVTSHYWLDKLNLTDFSMLTPQRLGNFLSKEIVVGWAVENTAQETLGADEFTGKFIWSLPATPTKGFSFVYYAPDTPSRRTPSCGYQYRVKKGVTNDIWTRTMNIEVNKAYLVDSEVTIDIAPVGLDLMYPFKDTILT